MQDKGRARLSRSPEQTSTSPHARLVSRTKPRPCWCRQKYCIRATLMKNPRRPSILLQVPLMRVRPYLRPTSAAAASPTISTRDMCLRGPSKPQQVVDNPRIKNRCVNQSRGSLVELSSFIQEMSLGCSWKRGRMKNLRSSRWRKRQKEPASMRVKSWKSIWLRTGRMMMGTR